MFIVFSYDIFYFSVESVVISPLSFLILFIWILSVFFLVNLARSLSVLFIFKKKTSRKKRNCSWFIDLFYFLISILFISSLIFVISFLLLLLGLFFLLFLIILIIKLGDSLSCLLEIFLLLKKACITTNFLLRPTSVASYQLCDAMLPFSFFSRCFLTSSLLLSLT